MSTVPITSIVMIRLTADIDVSIVRDWSQRCVTPGVMASYWYLSLTHATSSECRLTDTYTTYRHITTTYPTRCRLTDRAVATGRQNNS